jgi:hypothetical protein
MLVACPTFIHLFFLRNRIRINEGGNSPRPMAAGVTGKQNAVKGGGEEGNVFFTFLLPHCLKCEHLRGKSSSLLLMFLRFFFSFLLL